MSVLHFLGDKFLSCTVHISVACVYFDAQKNHMEVVELQSSRFRESIYKLLKPMAASADWLGIEEPKYTAVISSHFVAENQSISS